MKKVIFSLLFGFLVSVNAAPVFADEIDNALPLPKDNYDTVLIKNIFLKDRMVKWTHKGSPIKKGTENTLELFFSSYESYAGILVRINAVLGTIAFLWIVVLGAKFIFAQGSDEKIENYKEQFGWIVMGMATIAVAEFVAFEVLDPADTVNGGLLEGTNKSATSFAEKIMIFKTYIQYFIGGIALIKMMMSGYDLITGSEEDENIQKEKEFLQNFFFGGALILMAEVLARIFSAAKADNTVSLGTNLATIGVGADGNLADATSAAATQGITEVMGLVNFFLTFAGVCSVLMLVLSSIYYVISFGSDDQMTRAKRMVVTSVLGLVVIVSSYTLIRFLVR